MNASELVVKALENEGVEIIYGVPGEETLEFLEALRKSGAQQFLNRHELGAAFIAATYGRLIATRALSDLTVESATRL